MKRNHAIAMIFGISALSITAAVAERLAPAGYDLSWNTVDSGGGSSSGGTFTVDGTIGQPDASTTVMSGGTFSVLGGFWPGAGALNICVADVAPTGGNGLVDVNDLLVIINHWGNCVSPPVGCLGDIAPAGGNGVVDVNDLLKIINSWGLCPP